MTIWTALSHIAGALIAWVALSAFFLFAAAAIFRRNAKIELAAVALQLRTSLDDLASDPAYEPATKTALLERNSPDLLRNRLSDFAGLAVTLLGWVVFVAQLSALGAIIYVSIDNKSLSEVPSIWMIPFLTVLYAFCTLVTSILSNLLTGRLPGQAKRTRRIMGSL